jgi:hypothetical protein
MGDRQVPNYSWVGIPPHTFMAYACIYGRQSPGIFAGSLQVMGYSGRVECAATGRKSALKSRAHRPCGLPNHRRAFHLWPSIYNRQVYL